MQRHIHSLAVWLAGVIASQTARRAAESLPELAFRGCICFGRFEMDANFIVGEAVDDAAEHLNRAQGALVWLAPSATTVASGTPPGSSGKFVAPPFVPWSVPLKGGDSYETLAITPFGLNSTVLERDMVIRNIDKSFTSDRIDVQIKKQHTMKFLRGAAAMISAGERVRTEAQEASEKRG